MKLVWTYNSNVTFGNQMGQKTIERETILINYYICSIQSAIKLGYYTIVYCDKTSYIHFKDTANEVIVLDSYQNSSLWDSFKIDVLENRNDDFCLIDGDVILHNKLPEFTTDITFDSYEINNFKYNYEDVVDALTNIGISNVIDCWENKRIPIISCGILHIMNNELKQKYIFYWKKYNEFISQHLNNFDIDLITMVGAQYLLSILAQNLSHTKLSNLVGVNNLYYKHHCGPSKYNNPIVPNNYLIYQSQKSIC